jgi:hypothetical protein
MNLIGYRKLIFAAFAFISSMVLMLCGKMTADQFVALQQWVIPSFMASSIAEKYLDGKKTDVSE